MCSRKKPLDSACKPRNLLEVFAGVRPFYAGTGKCVLVLDVEGNRHFRMYKSERFARNNI